MQRDTPKVMFVVLLVCGSGRYAAALEPPHTSPQEVEVGVGHVSEDSAKFGRYNGLNKEGAFAIGDIDTQVHKENGYYGAARGTNLGLTSRYLRLGGGKQGKVEGFVEFDQLDVHNSDTAVTPFRGNDSLRLPDLWNRGNTTQDMPQLSSSLRSVDLETERKRYGGGVSIVPKKHWSFDVSYHREQKSGTGQIGGSMAFLGASSILPQPVDYTTDELEAVLGYTRDKGQLQLTYHMSLFNDDNDSLTWDNPFSQGYDAGKLALPPDNQFHQVSLSGGYRLPWNTRLTGMASVGLMHQDASFLPFTTNPAFARPLPRSDLSGKVYVKAGRIQLNSRPLPKWDYTTLFRFYGRDNDTPQDNYDYVIVDQFPGGTRRNRPYSYRQYQIELRAGYRMSKRIKLSLGYRFDNTSRNQAEVHNTHDNTLKATLRVRARNDLSAAVHLSGSRRSESGNYRQFLVTTNPDLRISYLAKRKQAKAGTSLNYTPTPRISLGASADYVYDNYDDTEIGLRNSSHPTYNLDATYMPVDHVTTYAFYTRDSTDTKQSGSQVGAVRDWNANTDDTADTYGIGVKWDSILNRFDLGADYVYNRAKGKIGLHSDGDYPNLTNRLKSLKLYGRFHLKKDLDVQLTYLHASFNSDDWAIDGVAPDTIDQVLSQGEESPHYDVNVFTVSMIYRLF
jgi:MtrB/PioB family decaheme-associated outer membrane protein